MHSPRSTTLTLLAREYRRDARVTLDGQIYRCDVSVAPGDEPPRRLLQPGSETLAHRFLSGWEVLSEFYRALHAVLRPVESVSDPQEVLWSARHAWRWMPYDSDHYFIRAVCAISATTERPFDDVVEAFLRAEHRRHPAGEVTRTDTV